jgi:hypothetical protein
MSHTRIQRLVAVRREFEAARRAVGFFVGGWSQLVNTVDTGGLQLQDFRAALHVHGLERTYIIRLFSQFEAELRLFLRERVPRPAENLINRVASMQHIDADITDMVHDVRLYRNTLVHEANIPAAAVSFEDALTFLNRFLAWLPEPR